MRAILSLMFRMLVRDLRAGELTVLGVALVVAVTALTGVSFLTDRVAQALVLQSRQLLGGDLLLSADHPWSDTIRREAESRGLHVAGSASFPSMVSSAGHSQLADLKAVSEGYPLRGVLRIAPAANADDAPVRGIPPRGSVWVDERLLSALEVRVGDPLQVGQGVFSIAAVLTQEPERGLNAFAFAPRVLLNDGDLARTGLVQEGSRIVWRRYVAGKAPAVSAFREWMQPHLERGERMEGLDDNRPEVRMVLERAERFLRLAALLSVVLAAVAVGLAANRYLRHHLDGCAVMRCLGASSNQVLLVYGGEFLLLGMAASLLGAVLGFAVQGVLQGFMAGLLADSLPLPSWQPWVQGLAVGLTLVAGFALPPLLRLRSVPAVRVLRREWAGAEPYALSATLMGALALGGLMFWMAGDATLGSIVLAGFAAAILIYAVVARLLMAVLGRLRGAAIGIGWRYGLAGLRRRLAASLAQTVALGLGLTALLLVTVVREDLVTVWQARMPPDAPNRFVINIQPEQRAGFTDFFRREGLPPPSLEPMVRGRLVAVNGHAVTPESYPEERARRLVEREFNLSWSSRLPSGNTVVAGIWHGDGQGRTDQFSVEQGLAETLGLRLGDRLDYDIAGRVVSGRITSLRKLEWDSMRVNFFVIAPPDLLHGYPVSYITSFHLPHDRRALTDALVREMPNLTVIDMDNVVRQVRDTLDRVTGAVELVFGFALLAGLMVLYAALQATADERMQELAVLRTLGARRGQMRRALATEFAALGAMAGLLGALGAAGIAWGLAHQVLHLPYLPAWPLSVQGIVAGLTGVVAAGLWGTRHALRDSPLRVLRESG